MSGLFGGGAQAATPAAPTTVAPPPDRSDAETQALAARQKARFTGSGSFTRNYLSNGADTGASTTSKVLGGA